MRIYLFVVLTVIGTWTSADQSENLVEGLEHNSTYYYTETSQSGTLPEEWNVDGFGISLEYRSFDNSVGCFQNCVDDTATFDVDMYDSNGVLLGTAGMGDFTIDYDGGGWSPWYLIDWYFDSGPVDEIASYEWTMGGKDNGFWGGYYGPQFRNSELYFTYSVPETVSVEDVANLANQTIDLIDDIIIDYTPETLSETISEDFNIDPVGEDTSSEEIADTDVEEPSEPEEVADGQPEEESKEETVAEVESGSSEVAAPVSNIANNAFATFQLVQDIVHTDAPQIGAIGSINGFDAYTGIELTESVALNDNEDWYSDVDFYGDDDYAEHLNLTDTINLTEKAFYGSNNQFY